MCVLEQLVDKSAAPRIFLIRRSAIAEVPESGRNGAVARRAQGIVEASPGKLAQACGVPPSAVET